MEDKDSTLLRDLEALVESDSRGDPMSPLRWTLESTRQLAAALGDMGHQVSHSVVGVLLHEARYSLQANAKVNEGNQHSDRNGQFERTNNLAAARLASR